MKYKICSLFSILLILSGNSLPIYSANEIEPLTLNKEISTDYLKKLPLNDYIIGYGDTLNIIVSREYIELNSKVTVDGEGTIYLPRLNRIFVNGLTLDELRKVLNKAFLKFVKYPDVEVQVLEYRPVRVLVQGEVENPGLQTLLGSISLQQEIIEENRGFTSFKGQISQNLAAINQNDQRRQNYRYYFPTVFDAIRESGGITNFADLKKIQIIRNDSLTNGGGKISATINFEEVINSGDNSQNIRIYDSDVIKVFRSNAPNSINLRKAVLSNLNPKYIEVFVTGRVRNPGRTVVTKASVLTDAIDISGGTKVLKGKLTFIRFNNDGSIDKRRFRINRRSKRGSFYNPILRNGDLLVVEDNFLTISNEILSDVTKPFVGIFSTYGLLKAIND